MPPRLALLSLVAGSTACFAQSTYSNGELTNSLVSLDSNHILADGHDAALITIHARSNSHLPVPGLKVVIVADQCTARAVQPATDAAGYALATVTSTQGGIRTVTVELAAPDDTPLYTQKFIVTFAENRTQSGLPTDVSLVVDDANGLIDLGYQGTVTFRSSDPLATLPGDYVFDANRRGKASLPQSVTFYTAGQQTLSAVDVATGRVVSASTFTVDPQTITSLELVGLPGAVDAGTPLDITVVALDRAGNLVKTYVGEPQLVCTDANASLATGLTVLAADAGRTTAKGGVVLREAGLQTLVVIDNAAGLVGTSRLAVSPGPTTQLLLSGAAQVDAGAAYTLTVNAADAYGNLTAYAGTLHLESSDAGAQLPADAAMQGGALRYASGEVRFGITGSQTLTAYDASNQAIRGSSTPVNVMSTTATQLALVLPANTTAGTPANLLVKALDALGNIVPNYAGTVRFANSDAAGTAPSSYTFTPNDAGIHNFIAGVTFERAGQRTVSASDANGLTGTSTTLVGSGALASLSVVASVSSSSAGQAFSATVAALDAFANPVTTFSGQVSFATGDAQATLPAAYTFTNADQGAHGFTGIVLRSSGAQTLTATTAGASGSATMAVSPIATVALRVSGAGPGATPGTRYAVQVVAVDMYNNTTPAYSGRVALSSSDPGATLPAAYTFVPGSGGDAGAHAFSNFALAALGNQTVTALDGSGLTGTQAVAVDAVNSIATGMGDAHCVQLASGQAKCWGANGPCQLGDNIGCIDRGVLPGDMGSSLPALNLGTGRSAIQIANSVINTCALLDNHQVKCWGDNFSGQLGLGDSVNRGGRNSMGDALPAVNLGTGRTAVSLSSGGYAFTCAVLDTGAVKCWGRNSQGQLGIGDAFGRGSGAGQMGDALPAVDLGTGRTATAVACGWEYACAILDNGDVKCWGANDNQQLGIGDPNGRGATPGQMGNALPPVAMGTGRTAKALTLGHAHACIMQDTNQIKCWGRNPDGQIGVGDTRWRGWLPSDMGDNLAPVDLGTGRTPIELAAGEFSTCVLLDNHQVKCWGWSSDGRLGMGDLSNRGDQAGQMGDALPAVNLGTGRTALHVGLGSSSVCAVLDTRDVKCWGYNRDGQLGVGDPNTRGSAPGQMGDGLSQTLIW